MKPFIYSSIYLVILFSSLYGLWRQNPEQLLQLMIVTALTIFTVACILLTIINRGGGHRIRSRQRQTVTEQETP